MSAGWGSPSWMQPGPVVGETFVPGKTPQTARALLDAAAELGLDPTDAVRTINGGFVVPNEVSDRAAQILTPEDELY